MPSHDHDIRPNGPQRQSATPTGASPSFRKAARRRRNQWSAGAKQIAGAGTASRPSGRRATRQGAAHTRARLCRRPEAASPGCRSMKATGSHSPLTWIDRTQASLRAQLPRSTASRRWRCTTPSPSPSLLSSPKRRCRYLHRSGSSRTRDSRDPRPGPWHTHCGRRLDRTRRPSARRRW